MNKLNKVSASSHATSWGSVYHGVENVELSHAESHMQAHIRYGTLPIPQAKRVYEKIDAKTPFVSRLEFITGIASLTAIFWTEVSRKTHIQSKTLAAVLLSATEPDRVEWYFNNMRCRHAADPSILSLLGSGTSQSESLHHE
eukprot:3835342-Karenia_brevis.AAC.1